MGRSGDRMAVAWADISTGDFAVQEVDEDRFEGLLSMLNPAELVFPAGMDVPDAVAQLRICCTEQTPSLFDSTAGNRALCDYFGTSSLDGFGQFSRAMTSAAGALLAYMDLTQKGNLPRLRPLPAAPISRRPRTDGSLIVAGVASPRGLRPAVGVARMLRDHPCRRAVAAAWTSHLHLHLHLHMHLASF